MLAQTTITKEAAKAPYVAYNDRYTNLGGYEIKVKATMADMARKVHNHNLSRGFTNILLIGDSGSGKTTAKINLSHELHLRHPYVIKNYHEKEILNIKSILHELPKHTDYILVFDDVSFLIKKGQLKESDLMDMFHELTKVRHTVKGRVIAIFMIHYPYAIEKFMRQAGYRILTSITDDEREIYIKLFGPQWRRMVEQFIIDDRYQTEENRFNLPDPRGAFVPFVPKQPFKLALASRMGDLTYLVYQKIDCEICEQTQYKALDKPFGTKLYEQYEPDTVVRAFKWFAFAQTGVSLLRKDERTLWHRLQDYAQNNSIDYAEMIEVAKRIKKYRRKEKPSPDELRYFIKQEVDDLDARLKEKHKASSLPEDLLTKDETKEPGPELEDEDEENDEDELGTDFQTKIENSVMQQDFSEDGG